MRKWQVKIKMWRCKNCGCEVIGLGGGVNANLVIMLLINSSINN